jgi:hypothetical protein
VGIEQTQAEFLAAWIYTRTSELRAWTFPTSPGWRFYPHVSKVMDLIQPGLDEVQKAVRQSSEQVWEAPSAWHAALYCGMMQHHMVLKGGRLLFRGHSCESWDLNPSIMRPGVDVGREKRRGEVFAQLLASVSINTMRTIGPELDLYLRVTPQSYLGAAQHYGIKTDLLDFTTDPDVAVWFATQGGDSNEWACVHILQLNSAEDSGQAIVLPPPFVRRLHLQRGMFLIADSERLAKQVKTIRFPRRPSAVEMADFQVRREDGRRVELLPDEALLVSVRELSDRIVEGEVVASSQDEIDALARTLKPHLSGVYADPIAFWAEYLDVFEDSLYAILYDFDENDALVFDENRLAAIIRNNVETCCSFAAIYRAMPRLAGPEADSLPGKFAFQAKMADIIDGIAARECGYVHDFAAKQYAEAMGFPRNEL